MKGGNLKNLLIIGPPRCGKTTLAQMIAEKYPCEIIRGDCIEISVCQAILDDRINETLKRDDNTVIYPDLEDSFKVRLYKQLYEQIKIDLHYNNKLIILDAHQCSLDLLEKAFGDEVDIYCVGMPNSSAQEIFNYIRLNDSYFDWSTYVSNVSLKKFCEQIVSESKKLEKEVKKHPQIHFFDTSGNRRKILQTIFEDIERNLK